MNLSTVWEHAARATSGAFSSIDWSLVVVVGGFLVPVSALFGSLEATSPDTPANPVHVAYESAIAEAAVKRPSYVVSLETIDAATATVNVVTFGPSRVIPETNRTFDLWVALPDQLRAACAGAEAPALRLQQVLGLPPVDVPGHVVTELSVPRDGLFRPCVAGGDLDASACDMDLPTVSADNADPEDVREAYDRMRFLTSQMWNSYRAGFLVQRASADDYPGTGYPFTGMGWSFDWSDVPNHLGVSEFVVERDAQVSVVGSPQTPAAFCAPGATDG